MFVVCFVHCFRIVYDANIIPNSEMNLKFYKNLFFLRRRSFLQSQPVKYCFLLPV